MDVHNVILNTSKNLLRRQKPNGLTNTGQLIQKNMNCAQHCWPLTLDAHDGRKHQR